MNTVFLSPHFPPNWYHFAVGLRKAGATVLGIGDAPYDSLRVELRDALAEYYRVDDLHHYDELLRALGFLIHKHGRIDRLDSLNEYWLETEARLRTDFNIPGIREDDIATVKRKSMMKACFRDAGLAPARGRVCRTPEELRAFVRDVGLPVVAKPDAGVGAARTYKLESEADLERYLREKPPIDYIVEEFVRGQILTYDGLCDRAGRVVFASSLTYSTGVMDVVNQASDIYFWVGREISGDVEGAGQAIARAFDVRERPFHFEFFRTPQGDLVPLEVNMRPPGGMSVDMVNHANEIDFYQEWANVVVNGVFEAVVTRPYFCMYVSRRDARRYVRPDEDVLREFAPLLVDHGRNDPAIAAAMGDRGYVLRDPHLEPLVAAARWIQEVVE